MISSVRCERALLVDPPAVAVGLLPLVPECAVLPEREGEDHAVLLAVLRDVPDAHVAPGPGARPCVMSSPKNVIVPESALWSPMIASTSSVWPLPSTPAMPTTSPRWIVNDTFAEPGDPVERDGEVADRERRIGGDRALAGLGRGELAADHHLGEVVGVHRARVVDLADGTAGADDGDRVGVLEHLVELVRDEDRRRPAGGELGERVEQLVDLLRHQHGGRLVEDDDLGAAVQHLEDLDALLLPDTEVAHQCVGVDLEAVALAELADLRARLACAEVPPRPRLVTEHDVLPDREVVGQLEVLEHHADAGADRVTRRFEVLAGPVHRHRALVGLVGAVQRLHERRLPGPVLADDRMDRSGANREVDTVVGDDTREALDDVTQLDRDRAADTGGDGPRHGEMFYSIRRCVQEGHRPP